MAKKVKTRETLEQMLASCSDSLFPDQMGQAPVTLESRSVDGDMALHVMVWRDNTYGACAFIDAGADVNAVGDMSETPLHVAVRKGNLEIVRALLEAGAHRFAMSEFGKTPAELAAERAREWERPGWWGWPAWAVGPATGSASGPEYRQVYRQDPSRLYLHHQVFRLYHRGGAGSASSSPLQTGRQLRPLCLCCAQQSRPGRAGT